MSVIPPPGLSLQGSGVSLVLFSPYAVSPLPHMLPEMRTGTLMMEGWLCDDHGFEEISSHDWSPQCFAIRGNRLVETWAVEPHGLYEGGVEARDSPEFLDLQTRLLFSLSCSLALLPLLDF